VARFSSPYGVVVDSEGNVIVADGTVGEFSSANARFEEWLLAVPCQLPMEARRNSNTSSDKSAPFVVTYDGGTVGHLHG